MKVRMMSQVKFAPNIVRRKKSEIKGRLLKFRGENFLYSSETREIFFRIQEPYYSAGKKYGWNPPIGLGINEDALNFAVKKNLRIGVFVGNTKDRYYSIPAYKWRRFALKHNSIEEHGSTKIYIAQFSDSLFNTIYVENSLVNQPPSYCQVCGLNDPDLGCLNESRCPFRRGYN